MKIDILGVGITKDPKQEILKQLEEVLLQPSGETAFRPKQKFIVTPYSEFFQRCFRDQLFRAVLNSADIALPDGIVTVWLAHYLSLTLKSKSFYAKTAEAFFLMLKSGLQIIFAPSKIRDVLKEKISGSDFFWDLSELAERRGASIFLAGGFGETPFRVAEKIRARFPNSKIAGTFNGSPGDPDLPELIKETKPDILMVAFGPGTQEFWIAENLKSLPVKIAIGLGGTFDYVSGNKILAPAWVRNAGLEWLFRLFTQPSRFRRIWNATFKLLVGVIRFKVWSTMPFRKNVVGVIIDKKGRFFLASRILDPKFSYVGEGPSHWQFPQGGVNSGEDLGKAVLREVREETGMVSLKLLGRSKQFNSYVWNNTLRPLMFNIFKFKGQEQTVFFLRFEGEDSEIKLDHIEFSEWKWVEPAELERTIHPFRIALAKIALSEINNYI